MNIGRSTKIALAQRDKNNQWLADEMGVHRSHITRIKSQSNATGATIEILASAFNLKASEFIALGEVDCG